VLLVMPVVRDSYASTQCCLFSNHTRMGAC
jgi:hypothetical protein